MTQIKEKILQWFYNYFYNYFYNDFTIISTIIVEIPEAWTFLFSFLWIKMRPTVSVRTKISKTIFIINYRLMKLIKDNFGGKTDFYENKARNWSWRRRKIEFRLLSEWRIWENSQSEAGLRNRRRRDCFESENGYEGKSLQERMGWEKRERRRRQVCKVREIWLWRLPRARARR